MVEGYQRAEPSSVAHFAVPITLPKHYFKAALLSSGALVYTIVCLAITAFFYILCVGEYTKPQYVIRVGKHVRATRTQQFPVVDVGYFKDGHIFPRSSPIKVLLMSDSATLKFSHQKNNQMGETIHQVATGTDMCLVKSLARVVHTILQDGGTKDTLLCAFKYNDTWEYFQSAGIIVLVRTSTKQLKLYHEGIDPDLIVSHSL